MPYADVNGLHLAGWTDDQLRNVQLPVLILVGDTDFIHVENAAEAVRLLPQGQLAVLPGTTHMGAHPKPPAGARHRGIPRLIQRRVATGLAAVLSVDRRIIMVDRRHAPRGHWNDAHPFVRLHQPAACYGVNSRPLGNDQLDERGLNAGLST
jgi:hypothetical protein